MAAFQIPRFDLMSRKGYWIAAKNPTSHPFGMVDLEYVLYTEEELAERERKAKLRPTEEQQPSETSVPKTPSSPRCMDEYWTDCECSTCKFKRMLNKIANRNNGLDLDDDAHDADDEKSDGYDESNGGEYEDSSWDAPESECGQDFSEDEGEGSDADEELLSEGKDEGFASKNSSFDIDEKTASENTTDGVTSADLASASTHSVSEAFPTNHPFKYQPDNKECPPALSKKTSARSLSIGTPEEFFTPLEHSGTGFGSSSSSAPRSSIYDFPPPEFTYPPVNLAAPAAIRDVEMPSHSSGDSVTTSTSKKSPSFNGTCYFFFPEARRSQTEVEKVTKDHGQVVQERSSLS